VLLAGHQSRAEDLLTACSDAISTFSERTFGPNFTEASIDALLGELRGMARKKKAEVIRHYVEMTIGISFDEFKTLPTTNHIETWAEVRSLTLGADLLISCVPPDSEPVIVRLDRWGATHWESRYAAIGEGGEIARALLCLQPWDDSGRHLSSGGGSEPTLGQCLYRVYEAKRAAHVANPSSVGRATGIQVLWKGQKLAITQQCIESLEDAFNLKHNVPGFGPNEENTRYLVTVKPSWLTSDGGPTPW
jgi:hypothetical protein